MTYFVRLIIEEGNRFGECLGNHTAWLAAESAVDKDHRGESIRVAVIEHPEKLTKGQCYPEIATAYNQEQKDNRATQLMIELIEARSSGKGIDRVADTLELYGFTVEGIETAYGERARCEMDRRATEAQAEAERHTRIMAARNQLEGDRAQFTYSFPAVSGIQAGKQYFTAQVPFKALIRLFTFDDEDLVPAELRAQRQLNEVRAYKISRYMIENRFEYVLPSLTASVNSAMHFESIAVPGAGESLGLLHIPMDRTLLINDGQHRRKGIEHALKENPQLVNETIAVTLFFDEGLTRSQQMFADINNHQVKPSSAISMVYNHRDPFSAWIIGLLKEMPRIHQKIEMEKSSVGPKSIKLWSVVAFKKFLERLLAINSKQFEGVSQDQRSEMQETVICFLNTLDLHLPHWETMIDGGILASEVREHFVIGHAVFLEALGVMGQRLMEETGSFERVGKLQNLNVSKRFDGWENRCVILGKMNKTADGVKSTGALLCKFIGLELPAELKILHERVEAL